MPRTVLTVSYTHLDGGKEFTAKNWLRRQQLCLQKTMEGLEEEAFRQAVSALLSARRVFLYARGTSSSIGKFLMLHLRRLGVEALLMSSGTGVPEDCLLYTSRCV